MNALVGYLEEKLCAFLHDLLDLEEAGGVHEQELISNVHAEASCVAESQDLLEALRLHSRGQLHHWALPPSIEQIPEVGAAGCQNRTVGLRGKQQGKASHLNVKIYEFWSKSVQYEYHDQYHKTQLIWGNFYWFHVLHLLVWAVQ